MHASVTNASQFALWRALLGFAEGANFPAVFKALAAWFPPSQRSLARGLVNAGVNLAAKDDFARLGQVPVLFAWREGMGHTGTYREPNGGILGPVAVSYLNWRLKGDRLAARMFTGPDCTLCLGH
ncbi:MAG: MFS transporter [Bryobacteraceae bacterium]|nr:MFS transporter [Bryobacteraceae bacterium]